MSKINVVPYNPAWPRIFEEESHLLKSILEENLCDLHHIGLTAVPNLSTKSIIDVLPVVYDITKVDSLSKGMEYLGYTCKGKHGMPFRRFFHK